MRKIKTNLDKIGVLIDIAMKLDIVSDSKYSYGNLFDQLMDKVKNHYPLFDYIYERIKNSVFDCISLDEQREEFIRLLNVEDLKSEFENDLTKCLNSLY